MPALTNHQILQLAARAAGKYFDPTRHDEHGLWVVRDGAYGQEDQVLWNSLKSDEDARELKEKLKLIVIPPSDDYPYYVCQDEGEIADVAVLARNLPGRARRRAITLAAAELGKRKP